MKYQFKRFIFVFIYLTFAFVLLMNSPAQATDNLMGNAPVDFATLTGLNSEGNQVYEEIQGMAIDDSGYIYVTGRFLYKSVIIDTADTRDEYINEVKKISTTSGEIVATYGLGNYGYSNYGVYGYERILLGLEWVNGDPIYEGTYSELTGVAVDNSGNIYVIGETHPPVQDGFRVAYLVKMDAQGTIIQQAPIIVTGAHGSYLQFPRDIEADDNGNIYVRCEDDKVYRITESAAGTGWDAAYEITSSSGLTDIAVCNNTLYGLNSTFGFAWKSGYGNLINQYAFNYGSSPYSMAFDNDGNIYIEDGGPAIRKFDPNGNFVSLYATGLIEGSVALRVEDMVIDNSGNIYFHGYDNKIHKITPASNNIATSSTITASPAMVITSYGDFPGAFYVPAYISTITVTLKNGSTPLMGHTVGLSARNSANVDVISNFAVRLKSSTSGDMNDLSKLTQDVTDGNGNATFTVASPTPQTVTFSATDVSTGTLLAQTANVTFVGYPDLNKSSMIASRTYVPSDNTSAVTITAILKDENGNPEIGHNVYLKKSTNFSSNVIPSTGQTNDSGMVSFIVTSANFGQRGASDYKVVDQTLSYLLGNGSYYVYGSNSKTIFFTLPPSASNCTMASSPSSVAANGTASATITVTLKDDATLPITGKTVSLTANGGSSVITPVNDGMTDNNGIATFIVKDSVVETVTYSASAEDWKTGANVTVTQTAAINFVTPPEPVITTQPSNKTVTAGQATTYTVVATGDAPLRYQWKKDGIDITGATSATLNINNVQPSDAGSYTVVVTNEAGNVTSDGATLTVIVPPMITAQPSDQFLINGNQVIFTVVASGDAPLTYQWKKDGNDLSDGLIPLSNITIIGANTPILFILGNVSLAGGSYTVMVTNAGGSVTSDTATLITPLNAAEVAPSIGTQPTSVTKNTGETATFTVTATTYDGGWLTYQWQKSTDNGATWNDIESAGSASYTTGVLTAADNGNQYRCVVVNANNAKYKNSKTATLTVNLVAVAPTIDTQPSSVTKNIGEKATFTVAATASDNGTLTYQWQKSTDSATTWNNIADATSASYTTGALTAADNGSQYRCVVTNTKYSTAVDAISDAATLTVNPAVVAPSITTQPGSVTKNIGETATFTVAATATDSGTITYQWQKSTDNAANWNAILGETSASYTTAVLIAADNGNQYRCVVTNTKNATTAATNSNAAILTVNPAAVMPSITTQPASVNKNIGETATFSVAATASDNGTLTYQWTKLYNYKYWNTISGATSASYTTGVLTAADNGNQYKCTVKNSKNNTSKSNYSDAAILTINEAAVVPSIDNQPASVTKNIGESATFTIAATASDSGTLTYQWQKSTDNATTWNNIADAASASYTTGALTAGDNGSQYRCVVTNTKNATSAVTNSDAAALTLNPAGSLLSLSMKEGTNGAGAELIQNFNGNNLTYSVKVNQNVEAVTVSATGDPAVKIKVCLDSVVKTDGIVTLANGDNIINVVVSEPNKIDKTYTITVTRGSVDECFIATAAFGSKFEPAVILLRHFRDQYLLTNKLGTAFVNFYYQNSPPIAAFIARSEILKAVVRIALVPFIVFVYMIYNPILGIIAAVFGVLAFLIIMSKRKQLFSI